MKKSWNKKLWHWHHWLGLYVGLVVVFLSITGTLALFKTELDVLLNRDLLRVEPAGARVPMDQALAKVQAEYPELHFFEIHLPKKADESYNFRFLPESEPFYQRRLIEVFVNPYTGNILGSRDYFATFGYFLRNIHVRFFEGWIGRQLVGIAGLGLLVLLVTGLIIYFPFTKRQKFGQVRTANSRQYWADLHKHVGLASLLFNLVIAGTGAWLGLQVWLMEGLKLEIPNRTFKRDKVMPAGEDKVYPLQLDQYLSAAETAFPDMIPFLIRPGINGQGLVEVMGDLPGTVYERYTNKVILDKRNASVEYVYDLRTRGTGEKFYFIQEALHFGDFGGIWLKLFYALFGLTSGGLAVAGYWIYLKRNQKSLAVETVVLQNTIYRYGVYLLGFISITAIMNGLFGVMIPTILVTVAFYAFITYLLLIKLLPVKFRVFRVMKKWKTLL